MSETTSKREPSDLTKGLILKYLIDATQVTLDKKSNPMPFLRPEQASEVIEACLRDKVEYLSFAVGSLACMFEEAVRKLRKIGIPLYEFNGSDIFDLESLRLFQARYPTVIKSRFFNSQRIDILQKLVNKQAGQRERDFFDVYDWLVCNTDTELRESTLTGQYLRLFLVDEQNRPPEITSLISPTERIALLRAALPDKQASTGVATSTERIKLFYDDRQRILFLNNETYYKLTPKEQTLFDYLKNTERDVEDISEEIWDDREARGNSDSLKLKLNTKLEDKFDIKLIRNTGRGEGMYCIGAKITGKEFKK